MTATTLSVRERYDATRPRLLAMLDEMARAGRVRATLYLTPGAATPDTFAAAADVREAVRALGDPDTGVAVFWEPDSITAVAPPFPIGETAVADGLDAGPLAALLGRRLRVAVVMIRLGRYAVGVLDGDALVASKTDTRYVKSRHRKGGSSQRRSSAAARGWSASSTTRRARSRPTSCVPSPTGWTTCFSAARSRPSAGCCGDATRCEGWSPSRCSAG